MSKMNLKKYSIYEFSIELNGEPVSVVYKKNDENSMDSIVSIDDGKSETTISAALISLLHEALNEIDPYSFVFSDLDEKE